VQKYVMSELDSGERVISGTLWLGAAIVLASTAVIVAIPDVRRPR